MNQKQKLTTLLFLFLSIGVFSQEKKKDSIKKWKVNGVMLFQFNQSSFNNWTPGGQNTIAGNFGINYDFNYTKGRWKWENKIIAFYGLSYNTAQGLRKTDDRFEYNSLIGLKSNTGHWFFSFQSNLRTQMSRGFDYKQEPKVLISDLFSPAYWSFGFGLLWNKSKNARLNISPISSRLTIVSDTFSGKFGVDEGKNVAYGFGFNLDGYYKFKVMENITMENILRMYSDYLDKPLNVDIDYQTNLIFKINKYFSMNFLFHMVMDSNAASRLQFRQAFGLGMQYVFHKR